MRAIKCDWCKQFESGDGKKVSHEVDGYTKDEVICLKCHDKVRNLKTECVRISKRIKNESP